MRVPEWVWFLLWGLVRGCAGRESEWTSEVKAGREECFYESVTKGETLDIEYQVVDGGTRNELDINFSAYRPDGALLVSDVGKPDNAHHLIAEITGDFKICFDNSNSMFSNKIVFFELMVDNEEEEEEEEPEEDEDLSFREEGEIPGDYRIKVSVIDRTLKVIKEHMSRCRHFQDTIRATEFRDRSVAEHNFENVNFWSTVHVAIMVFSGLCQVVLVRSLFDDKSRLHAFWKRLC